VPVCAAGTTSESITMVPRTQRAKRTIDDVMSTSFPMIYLSRLTYGTNLARFGIITPIAMHAAFNTVSRFLGGLFAGTEPSAPIPFELVMALCGIAIGLVLTVATRGRLAYREEPAGRSIVTVGPH
jgi:hypothetical protein